MAHVSRALFQWVVVAAPEGVAGLFRRDAWTLCLGALSAIAWGIAIVLIVETLYARQADTNALPGGAWLVALPCAALGVWLARRTRSAR